MFRVFITTHGCVRRHLDAQRVLNYLSKYNYKIVYSPDEADYILFFTCGATYFATNKCFVMIKEFQKNYSAELIVLGCLPSIKPKELADIFKGKLLTSADLTEKLDKLDQLFPGDISKSKEKKDANIIDKDANIIEYDKYKKKNPIVTMKLLINFIQLGKNKTLHNMPFLLIIILSRFFPKKRDLIVKKIIGKNSGFFYYYIFRGRPLYHIRISWGCKGNCSYCGIKKAIGPHISKPIEICVEEIKNGLKNGYKDFIISGDDTGAYGIDKNCNFPALIDKMTDIKGEYKIRFVYGLNPVWIVKYIDNFEKIIKKGKIETISCPIQSGSPRILKLMNRYNNVEKMKEALIKLKKYHPDLSLGTHIILGFPTETMDDVDKTLLFIKKVKFDIGMIFYYTDNPNTKSEKMMPKIPDGVIKKRMNYFTKALKKQGYQVIFYGGVGTFYKK